MTRRAIIHGIDRAIIHGIDVENALWNCDSSRLELPQNRGAQRILRLQPGQNVGVKEVSDNIWLVTLMHYDLGFFDHETCRLEGVDNPFEASVTYVSGINRYYLPGIDLGQMVLLSGLEPPTY